MSAKEFDDLLKSTLSQNGFEYDPEDYISMTKQLAIARKAKPSRKILLVFLSLAACLAFAFIISGVMHRTEKPVFDTIAQADIKAAAPVQGPTLNNTTAIKNKNTSGGMPVKQKASTHKILYAAKISERTRNETNEKDKITEKQFYHGIGNEAIMMESVVKDSKYNQRQKSVIALGTSYHDEFSTIEKGKEYNRKLNISLAGGFNYGSLNQGYALGASARKNLNNKLYLEGDIAYINTNATGSLTPKSYSSAPNFSTNYQVSSPIAKNNEVSSFNYLQMSPVVGYHIHKKLTLGLGPDFQRLLQNNPSTATVASSESDKIAPDIDLGFVGKTEFAVSDRLNAGFLYREGMNNFLSGTNKYFDRNYFQFQLKYSLFNK